LKLYLKKFKDEERIFIPERVAREFIKNRDGKLADLVKALNDKKSRISPPELELSKLFQHMEQFSELGEISKNVNELIKKYKSSYSKMVDDIKSWRGNDPITIIYSKIFDKSNMIPLNMSEKDAIDNWEFRQDTQCPPGYKDSTKDDTGIGDFLIWMTLIETSAREKKDVIFVTGDQKSDWFVRGEKEALYVRPELIDEFQRKTNNQHIRLMKFDELLSENNISPEVVNEIKRAEFTNFKSSNIISNYNSGNVAGFDYSQNNGMINISVDNMSFNLKFSKASNKSIYIYNGSSGCKIARIKNKDKEDLIDISTYDDSSFNYKINTGEAFLYKKSDGSFLIGRILEIKDDNRGDEHDYVSFAYTAYEEGILGLIP